MSKIVMIVVLFLAACGGDAFTVGSGGQGGSSGSKPAGHAGSSGEAGKGEGGSGSQGGSGATTSGTGGTSGGAGNSNAGGFSGSAGSTGGSSGMGGVGGNAGAGGSMAGTGGASGNGGNSSSSGMGGMTGTGGGGSGNGGAGGLGGDPCMGQPVPNAVTIACTGACIKVLVFNGGIIAAKSSANNAECETIPFTIKPSTDDSVYVWANSPNDGDLDLLKATSLGSYPKQCYIKCKPTSPNPGPAPTHPEMQTEIFAGGYIMISCGSNSEISLGQTCSNGLSVIAQY